MTEILPILNEDGILDRLGRDGENWRFRTGVDSNEGCHFWQAVFETEVTPGDGLCLRYYLNGLHWSKFDVMSPLGDGWFEEFVKFDQLKRFIEGWGGATLAGMEHVFGPNWQSMLRFCRWVGDESNQDAFNDVIRSTNALLEKFDETMINPRENVINKALPFPRWSPLFWEWETLVIACICCQHSVKGKAMKRDFGVYLDPVKKYVDVGPSVDTTSTL